MLLSQSSHLGLNPTSSHLSMCPKYDRAVLSRMCCSSDAVVYSDREAIREGGSERCPRKGRKGCPSRGAQRGEGRTSQRHVIKCHVCVTNDALTDMQSRGTIRCDGVEAMLPKVDCVEIVICYDD
jgi:hypothetical protein